MFAGDIFIADNVRVLKLNLTGDVTAVFNMHDSHPGTDKKLITSVIYIGVRKNHFTLMYDWDFKTSFLEWFNVSAFRAKLEVKFTQMIKLAIENI